MKRIKELVSGDVEVGAFQVSLKFHFHFGTLILWTLEHWLPLNTFISNLWWDDGAMLEPLRMLEPPNTNCQWVVFSYTFPDSGTILSKGDAADCQLSFNKLSPSAWEHSTPYIPGVKYGHYFCYYFVLYYYTCVFLIRYDTVLANRMYIEVVNTHC